MSILLTMIFTDPNLPIYVYPSNVKNLEENLKLLVKSSTLVTEIKRTNANELVYIKQDKIIFACICNPTFTEAKALQFIDKFINLFKDYLATKKQAIENLLKMPNIKPYLFIKDVSLNKLVTSLLSIYNESVISNDKIIESNLKVNQIEIEMEKNIDEQIKANAATQELIDNSQEVSAQSYLFKENATILKEKAAANNWWMCSWDCLKSVGLIAGIIIVVLVVLMIFIL